jgi:hypothetical protein
MKSASSRKHAKYEARSNLESDFRCLSQKVGAFQPRNSVARLECVRLRPVEEFANSGFIDDRGDLITLSRAFSLGRKFLIRSRKIV